MIELYTSQGCGSCVPADAFLAQLAARKDVVALSLPITYWDMLGWKDTLATQANTDRQKAYAQAMGRGGVYTPQVIVDGIKDLVGSKEAAIDKTITAREAKLPDVPVTVSLRAKEVHVVVGTARTKPNRDATIWMMTVRPRATVKIGAGENAGRTLTYRDIVTEIKAVGLWKGKKVTLDLPRAATGSGPKDGITVIVQQGGYGPILGATPIDWPSPPR
ncbi:MAG: DUF1223 domain-containing protein [Alphaproteobacteria bacterium]|nr:DUF1223 domain-containing protein [Alphaproteobacteria bacterium]